MSRMNLAAAVGVAYETVISWEREDRVPRSEAIVAVAFVLRCKVEDLFEPLNENDPARTPGRSASNASDGTHRVES